MHALRGNACITKEERLKINNLSKHHQNSDYKLSGINIFQDNKEIPNNYNSNGLTKITLINNNKLFNNNINILDNILANINRYDNNIISKN